LRVDWSSRKIKAISSVVANETLTPVEEDTSFGSISRNSFGSMGAWPCLEAMTTKVSL